MPAETIEHNGEEFSVHYEEYIQCEHCEYEWSTVSESARTTCPGCQRKTDRDVKGKVYNTYLKYNIFSGDEQATKEVTERLRGMADLVEAMESNGWNFHQTTASSHLVMYKGDIKIGEIMA